MTFLTCLIFHCELQSDSLDNVPNYPKWSQETVHSVFIDARERKASEVSANYKGEQNQQEFSRLALASNSLMILSARSTME